MRTILVLIVLVPGVLAATKCRHAALLLYLWYAFFRPEDWIYFDVTVLRLSLIIGALLVVPSFLSGTYPNVTHPLSIGALVFYLAALFAQLGAVNQEIGMEWLEFLTKLILVSLLATTLMTDRRRFLQTVAVIALSFGFHAAKGGLYSLVKGGARFGDGLGTGAFSDNNGYALGMVMIVPMLVLIAQNTISRPLKWACAAAVPLVGIAVISTYSRGGFLALVVAALTLVIFQRHRFAWLVLAAIIAVPTGLFVSNQEGYLDRMKTIQIYGEINEVSAASRPFFWSVAIKMTEQNPFGVGLFNFESNYDRYDSSYGQYGKRRSVHSSHFQVLSETGLIGALAWTWLFVYSMVVIRRIRRRGFAAALPEDRQVFITGANALLASTVAFLVGGSFISLALNDLTWMTFALLAALDRVSAAAPMAQTSPYGALSPQSAVEAGPRPSSWPQPVLGGR